MHDDRVVARQLAGDGELAGGEGVGDQPGQWGLGEDGELRARRERRADERGEDEDEGRLGRERVDAGRSQPVKQPRAEPDASEICPEDALLEDEGLAGGRSTVDIDDQRPPEVPARGHGPIVGRPSLSPLSAAGVGGQEGDLVAGGERKQRLAGDLITVQRRNDVAVKNKPDGGGRRTECRRPNRPGAVSTP